MFGKKYSGDFQDALLRIFSLLIAFSLAFMSAGIIKVILRPHNPQQIKNLYATAGFSPEQNYLRLLWIIGITLLLYFLISRLRTTSERWFRIAIIIFAVFSIFCIDTSTHVANYA